MLWVTGTGERRYEFYVRQLRDMKGTAAIETMTPPRLAVYGELCGATLARAHARTGNAAKITGYLGDDDTFDRALERFAEAYADQNDADYAAFTQAAEEHRIEVERGV
jgi:sugar/nucleoside kinase (ribokinase family)